MIGITAYGGYLPQLRLNRQAVVEANAWYAPGLLGKGKGTRTMANWDEDSITMAVAAARDCLGTDRDSGPVSSVLLASTTLPFADRLNAGVVAEALNLEESTDVADMTGSQRVALSAVSQGLIRARTGKEQTLVVAADNRKTPVASSQELKLGDGAAAVLLGSDNVLAEYLGGAVVSIDFVDHFRATNADYDYHWEERWVRDEGIGKIVPGTVREALEKAAVEPEAVDYLIFPSTFDRIDGQIAKHCGIKSEAVVDNLAAEVGDTGVPHGLLLLARVLEMAQSGQVIVLAQFGQGAEVLVFRVTDAIHNFTPKRGVSGWLIRGVEENSYSRFLAYKDQLTLEKGMRGEQDKKTALSTHYRHHRMLTGFIAGRCRETGQVHFPPSRLSLAQPPAQDTQEPYPMADRKARVTSWSADYLSFSMAAPNQYGMLDFEGGGRLLMEFTDVAKGDVETGMEMEMIFRVKDVDTRRDFRRYFWKATPVVGQK